MADDAVISRMRQFGQNTITHRFNRRKFNYLFHYAGFVIPSAKPPKMIGGDFRGCSL